MVKKNKLWRNKKWLYNQYINLKKSTTKIGEEIGCSHVTICYWLKNHNILIRNNSESQIGLRTNENNPRWRGVKAGQVPKHRWARKYKPKPKACEICGKRTDELDLMSLTHEYTRNLNEYTYACRSCHFKYDYNKGFREITEETKKKMSEVKKGKKNPNYKHGKYCK